MFADAPVQVFLKKEQLSLDVIKQCRVRCPAAVDKQKVLKDMIFPNCEKLGQTIVFVTTRQNAHTLHRVVSVICYVSLLTLQDLHSVTCILYEIESCVQHHAAC